MAKRKGRIVQVFIVSWFPIGTKEAATIMCISRDHATRTVGELETSFGHFPEHNPMIHVDRTEVLES